MAGARVSSGTRALAIGGVSAVVLLAAGLTLRDADAPPAPRSERAAASDASPSATAGPAGGPQLEREEAVGAAVAEPAQQMPIGGGTAAQCRLCTGLPSGPLAAQRFLGECAVSTADAKVALLTATADVRPLAFVLPFGATRVRFAATGFQPVELPVPAMSDGVVDFGDVLLRPDAALRVRVHGLAAAFDGTVQITVRGERYSQATSAPAADAAAGVVLPAPSAQNLALAVLSQGQGPLQFAAFLPSLALRSGETRDCDIEVDRLPCTRIKLVGPSTALASQLSVWWTATPDCHGTVHLGAGGAAELRGPDPTRLSFTLYPLFDGGELQAIGPAVDGTLELAPASPVVGLRLRAADGAFAPFRLGSVDGTLSPQPLCVLPTARLEAAADVTASLADLGTLHWPKSAIAWSDDVGTLDVAAAARTSSLVITPTGPTPKERHRFRLLLQQEDGASTALSLRNGAFRTGELAPGRCALRWQIGDQPGPLARELSIDAGARTELQVPWPEFAMWEGTVTNWRAIPPGDRFLCVRFGTWKSFADGAQPRIDDAGHFALPLPADHPGPDARVEFRRGTQGLVGRVVAVDQPGHRVFVEHPAVRFVELRVEPRSPGRWMLHLFVDGQDGTPWQMLSPTQPSRALVPEGMTLHGDLSENLPEPGRAREDAGGPVTTAFVALDGSQREVTIRGGSGHWCAIRLERQSTRVKALLLDPQRRPRGFPCHIEPSGVSRLWVPAGASGIQVRLEPGGVQDFDAARDEITLR